LENYQVRVDQMEHCKDSHRLARPEAQGQTRAMLSARKTQDCREAKLRSARLRRYRYSNAIVAGALIAAAAMLLPAMLYAQEGSQEVSPPPGTSWGSPPVQGNWEPTDRGDAAQDSAQGTKQDAQDNANAQVLMAQQVMAEQSKRMADFMFWQVILGVALLIGVCVTIYYARQIARAAVNVGPRGSVTADPTQRAEGARINQRKLQP